MIHLIDISSSDSDGDIENDTRPIGLSVKESAAPSSRVLPSWASNNNTHPIGRGFNGQPHPIASPGERYNAMSKNVQPSLGDSSNRISSSNSHLQKKNNQDSSEKSKNSALPKSLLNSADSTATPGSEKFDAIDYVESQRSQKRALPSSLQPPVKHVASGGSAGNSTSGHSYNQEKTVDRVNTHLIDSGRHMRGILSKDNFDVASCRSRVLPPSLAPEKSGARNAGIRMESATENAGISMESATENDERLVFEAALQEINQPKHEVDVLPGLLSICLLRHQKIALAWMLQKERSLHCMGGILADDQGLGKTVSMIALILIQRYLQSKLDFQSNHIAESVNLDDDDEYEMGLDKVKRIDKFDGLSKTAKESTSSQSSFCQRPTAGTLVVCPASILRQWARELDEKVASESKLSVLFYHGCNREKDPVELAKHDVVLTTYSIVTHEFPNVSKFDVVELHEQDGDRCGPSSAYYSSKKKVKKSGTKRQKGKSCRKDYDDSSLDYDCGPLARVIWFRLVLDEAQTIKNSRTRVAKACCALRAKRRWCLSGTPIQNSIEDLYSYFKFLRYAPYDIYKTFYSSIKMRISKDFSHGYLKLHAILSAIMLRRKKDTLIDGECVVKLPPKQISLDKVDFSPEERAFYSKLEAESRSKFKAYAAAGTVRQNYANILLLLLRLRQACSHPLLVKGFQSESISRISVEMASNLPKDMQSNLLARLDTAAICVVCNDTPEDAVVTICGHVFCYQCVAEYVTGEGTTCPASNCKEDLGPDIVFSRTTLRSCLSEKPEYDALIPSSGVDTSVVLRNDYCSSKITFVLKLLQSKCKQNASVKLSASTNKDPEKAIVFSQWTSMLNLVEVSLSESCMQYRRFDGTMSLMSRDKAVKDFNTDPEVVVMLMSLKAGNLGLNLVTASFVVLLDPWWNPTTEDQAIDRAHRIGQTRPVTVSRITVRDTVEDRILALQEEKRKIVASAFGEDQGRASGKRLTIEDLKFLFGMGL